MMMMLVIARRGRGGALQTQSATWHLHRIMEERTSGERRIWTAGQTAAAAAAAGHDDPGLHCSRNSTNQSSASTMHTTSCSAAENCDIWRKSARSESRLTIRMPLTQCRPAACEQDGATRHTSHVTRHTSHVTRHTSHVTRHTSHVKRHTSHVTRQTSHVTCC
jgi:hypothetical protein